MTRRCNLSCVHCYSSSSPHETEEVDADLVVYNLEFLKEQGYNVLALSGGEPFLYSDLEKIIEAAKSHNFIVSVITNGISSHSIDLDFIKSKVDTIAVSFDGTEEFHNEVRGRKDAFQRSKLFIQNLRNHKIPFALSCTTFGGRLEDAVELYEFAAQEGATGIQFSPVAAVGRGLDTTATMQPLTDHEKARLLVIVKILNDHCDGPKASVSLAASDKISNARKQFRILDNDVSNLMLADLVNPLIVTETGKIQPFAYGLHDSYDIGNIRSINNSALEGWKKEKLKTLSELIESSLVASRETYTEWYEDLVSLSIKMSRPNGVTLKYFKDFEDNNKISKSDLHSM